MVETWSTRLRTVFLLVALLAGLLLWAGTLDPAPDRNVYPDENEFGANYDAYIGSQIETGGTVRTTDPLVIEVSPDGRPAIELKLTNIDPSNVRVGDEISVFGTLKLNGTVDVTTPTARSPWEYWYMYLVSFLAGLWTLGRFRRHWTLNTELLSFIPRESQ
jgi:hypothetical protein